MRRWSRSSADAPALAWQWNSHVPGRSSFQRTAKLSAGPMVRVSSGVPSAVRQRWPCGWNVESHMMQGMIGIYRVRR